MFTSENIPDGSGMNIAVVAARFNAEITEALTAGALDALKMAKAKNVKLFNVPGCYELPLVVKKLAESGRYDAVVALGAVVRGETPHFDYVAAETAAGLARASYDTGVPVSFGVLTTDDVGQAKDRAGGKHGNKGADAAYTAVAMARTLKSLD
ncbi:MAG: 6,7-dimethyl-8-ribityllumazine synthase [Actinomycetota bacterium]